MATTDAKRTRDEDFYVGDAWLDETDTVHEGENMFEILTAFRRDLKKRGLGEDEIQDILEEAQSGDYDHLVDTVIKYAL
jgi:hypothetical protein